MTMAEMPTSGDLKSGDSLFFTPPPGNSINSLLRPPPPAPSTTPTKCDNDLGHYIKSYMKYILSKFAINVFI